MRKTKCIWLMRHVIFLAGRGGVDKVLDFSTGVLRMGRGSLGIHGNPVSRHLNLKLYLTKGRGIQAMKFKC